MIFPAEEDNSYPLEWGGVSYDVMKLKVVYDREKIGFEDVKELDLKKGDIIAGRYLIEKILGNGVFAKVIRVRDLGTENEELTCFKIIQNEKDFLDQALDELKLLRYIKANCDPNEHYLLNFKQVFYHREHLFIETDLLKDNLLTAFQTNPSFFSLTVIKKIAIQLLEALSTLHSMNIIHADLKPENIMVKSYNPIEIRVIDLGNGSFTHDKNLSFYVQSRSYRAPEVVLGCGYNEKIDIWSLGCILAELWTKNVLFFNQHIQGMIARIQSIVGPWPEWMLQGG